MQDIQLFLNANTMNFDVLDEGIYMFIAQHNYEPYIVCSNETQNIIAAHVDWRMHSTHNDYFDTYKGYKILIDRTLQFGEIRIR